MKHYPAGARRWLGRRYRCACGLRWPCPDDLPAGPIPDGDVVPVRESPQLPAPMVPAGTVLRLGAPDWKWSCGLPLHMWVERYSQAAAYWDHELWAWVEGYDLDDAGVPVAVARRQAYVRQSALPGAVDASAAGGRHPSTRPVSDPVRLS